MDALDPFEIPEDELEALTALDPPATEAELAAAYTPDDEDDAPVLDWSAEYVAPDVLSDAEIELHLLELEGRIPDSMLRALRYTQAREYSRLCHREFLRGAGSIRLEDPET